MITQTNGNSPGTSQTTIYPSNLELLNRLFLFLFTFFLRNIRLRKKIGTILSSRYWEYFVIFLILLYCLLVFANFSLDDSNVSDVSDLRRFMLFLTYVELVILFFFAMEILGNMYVYGFKVIQTK